MDVRNSLHRAQVLAITPLDIDPENQRLRLVDEEAYKALHVLQIDIMLKSKRWVGDVAVESAHFLAIEGQAADLHDHLGFQVECALELCDIISLAWCSWMLLSYKTMRSTLTESGSIKELPAVYPVTHHNVSVIFNISNAKIERVCVGVWLGRGHLDSGCKFKKRSLGDRFLGRVRGRLLWFLGRHGAVG